MNNNNKKIKLIPSQNQNNLWAKMKSVTTQILNKVAFAFHIQNKQSIQNSIWKVDRRSEVQSQSQLQSKTQTTLGYKRPCLKIN